MANNCKDCKHDKGKCVGVSRAGSHRYCFEQKAMTNADRFRAMSDEEQQKCVRRFWEIEDFAVWLQQPYEED